MYFCPYVELGVFDTNVTSFIMKIRILDFFKVWHLSLILFCVDLRLDLVDQ